jgi:hypothetical protein
VLFVPLVLLKFCVLPSRKLFSVDWQFLFGEAAILFCSARRGRQLVGAAGLEKEETQRRAGSAAPFVPLCRLPFFHSFQRKGTIQHILSENFQSFLGGFV